MEVLGGLRPPNTPTILPHSGDSQRALFFMSHSLIHVNWPVSYYFSRFPVQMKTIVSGVSRRNHDWYGTHI